MRRRFTKAEREQYTIGTEIEWRNGAHWHPGVITGPISERDGWHSVQAEHTGKTTSTISSGARVDPGPTHIRLPQEST